MYSPSTSATPHRVNLCQRTQYPASVMVLVGVSYNGLASLVFFNQGERLIAQRYISDVPMPYVEPLSISLFRYHPWCL